MCAIMGNWGSYVSCPSDLNGSFFLHLVKNNKKEHVAEPLCSVFAGFLHFQMIYLAIKLFVKKSLL